MTMIDDNEYAIVKSELQFSIWPTHQPLPAGCRYTGPVGTRAEMETLLAQQFVETTPANHYRSTGFADSIWSP